MSGFTKFVVMDYEKKYKEAPKRTREFAKNHTVCNSEDICQKLFPEIIESEDDKIKKEILELVSISGNGNQFEEIKDWLEKQGEQKPEINDNILLRFAFYQYDDDTLYLSSVFVEECNRKHGYGAKILKAAEEVAKTFGISKIRLKVETNSWMEEWYKRNGYEYLTSEGKYDWLEKQGEQKPIDKVESKFKIGDWILIDRPCRIELIDDNGDYVIQYYDSRTKSVFSKKFCETHFHLWTIQDANPGDVLTCYSDIKGQPIEQTGIIKQYVGRHGGCSNSFEAFFGVDWDGNIITDGYMGSTNIFPATKEQRDLLFAKMKEAGYEWDAEKKELKKIEQKPAWSEEDDDIRDKIIRNYKRLCGDINISPVYKEEIDWLKSLEYRVQPQSKQKWSEEDEEMLERCIDKMSITAPNLWKKEIDWLKSLKSQKHWKPSEEQMKWLKDAIETVPMTCRQQIPLESLYNDLKKL